MDVVEKHTKKVAIVRVLICMAFVIFSVFVFTGWKTVENDIAQSQASDSGVTDEEILAGDPTSGFCGENLTWDLNLETGVLTISGTGDMKDYPSMERSPWWSYRGEIKSLVLEEGVTSIGNMAFYDCYGFGGDLVIPGSVISIGDSAFYGCSGFSGSLIIRRCYFYW